VPVVVVVPVLVPVLVLVLVLPVSVDVEVELSVEVEAVEPLPPPPQPRVSMPAMIATAKWRSRTGPTGPLCACVIVVLEIFLNCGDAPSAELSPSSCLRRRSTRARMVLRRPLFSRSAGRPVGKDQAASARAREAGLYRQAGCYGASDSARGKRP